MEENLLLWIKKKKENGFLLTTRNVRRKAFELSKFKVFSASKGWLEKLKKKNNIKLIRHKIQKNSDNFFPNCPTSMTLH